ncbi:MAG: hypothetical protein ACYDDF_05980 [Thermoplasmatota archaeon]
MTKAASAKPKKPISGAKATRSPAGPKSKVNKPAKVAAATAASPTSKAKAISRTKRAKADPVATGAETPRTVPASPVDVVAAPARKALPAPASRIPPTPCATSPTIALGSSKPATPPPPPSPTQSPREPPSGIKRPAVAAPPGNLGTISLSPPPAPPAVKVVPVFERTITEEENRESFLTIEKKWLPKLPKSGTYFELVRGKNTRKVTIDGSPCTCRGEPHEHYRIVMPLEDLPIGAKATFRLVRPDRLTLEIAA